MFGRVRLRARSWLPSLCLPSVSRTGIVGSAAKRNLTSHNRQESPQKATITLQSPSGGGLGQSSIPARLAGNRIQDGTESKAEALHGKIAEWLVGSAAAPPAGYKFVQLGLLSSLPALKAESVSDPSGPQTILPPPPILMTSKMITSLGHRPRPAFCTTMPSNICTDKYGKYSVFS